MKIDREFLNANISRALPDNALVSVRESVETARFKIYRLQYNCTPKQVFNTQAVLSKAADIPISFTYHDIFQETTHLCIEVPKQGAEPVLWEACEQNRPLDIHFGLSVTDESVSYALSEAPHMIIGGATGGGKSNFLHTILCSWISSYSPDELKLLLIDPKMVELVSYEDITHLLQPVLTEASHASKALHRLCAHMDERYALLRQLRVRNISEYNEVALTKMPYIVVVVDELAELLLDKESKAETALVRLGQKARAVGIHLVLSTQNFSAEIIKTTITSNTPLRVAFAVGSHFQSSSILGATGAECLLGDGDGLVSLGGNQAKRFQAPLITSEQINDVTSRAIALYGKADFSQGGSAHGGSAALSNVDPKSSSFFSGGNGDLTQPLHQGKSNVMVLPAIGQGNEGLIKKPEPYRDNGLAVLSDGVTECSRFEFSYPELTNRSIQEILIPTGFVSKNSIRTKIVNTESKAVKIIKELMKCEIIQETATHKGYPVNQEALHAYLSAQSPQLSAITTIPSNEGTYASA